MDFFVWLIVGILVCIGGLGGIVRKRFLGEWFFGKREVFTGKPAVALGIFFFLIGLGIIVNTILFYTAKWASQ